MHDVITQLLSYLRAIWQHRWYLIGVAWFVSLAGWVSVYLMPDRYEATARVFVDTQNVLKPLLQGLAIQPNVGQQITMMSRTLISRPNVEKVLRMTDLDIKAKTPEDKESLADGLISNIVIKGTGQDNLYTLAYENKNPDVAKRVVQALLTIFVEGSVGDNRKDADSARRFIDEQISAYEQKLVLAENSLKEFKREHLGLMPDQGKDYFARLNEAGAALSQASLQLREAENARDAIQQQLSGDDLVILSEQPALAGPNPEIDSRIQSLQQNLDSLRLKYTEQHPDITGAVRIIAQLEEQKKQQAALAPPPLASQNPDPVFQQLSVALAQAEATVASMNARVAEYQKRYDGMKEAVNAVPQVEADFTQLNRDYEVNKANYEKLLARRETAQISGEMDAQTGLVNFRIIDPPRVPTIPSAPNRPLLSSLALLGGLVAGTGVAFLISLARPTFNDRRSLREITGLPLLGTVSMMWTDIQKKRRKKGHATFTLSLLSLLGAYGAVMALLFLTMRTA